MNEYNFKLCYVKGPWAYFFDGEPTDIWGDDWNDRPYECNAGPPYNNLGKVAVVAYSGPYDEASTNTNTYSVQEINRCIVPWLRNVDVGLVIWAGTTLEEFIETVVGSGGQVYLPCSTRATNKVRRRPYAGKLGPWARYGCSGVRYLDIGTQDKPEYARIISAEKSLTWHWVRVEVEGVYGTGLLLRWCGCNIYE